MQSRWRSALPALPSIERNKASGLSSVRVRRSRGHDHDRRVAVVVNECSKSQHRRRCKAQFKQRRRSDWELGLEVAVLMLFWECL